MKLTASWRYRTGVTLIAIALNLTADFLFIVSLFVLGGDFWEKFRVLFIYDA